jgi:hypothetical protein
MWFLELSLDQNSIMTYHIFNRGFKSDINFGRTQEGHGSSFYHDLNSKN